MVPDGILMAASRYSKILERCDKWRCRQCLPPVLLKDFTDWRCLYWLTTYQPTYYRLCSSEIPLIELPVGWWTLSDPLALHQSSLWTIDDLSFLTISKQTFYFIISLQAFNTHARVCVCVMNINLSSPVLPFRPKKCFRQIVLKRASLCKNCLAACIIEVHHTSFIFFNRTNELSHPLFTVYLIIPSPHQHTMP